jgi:carbonic anhydrase
LYDVESSPQNAISPDAALARLMQGNARHAAGMPAPRDDVSERAALTEAQHPIAVILGCADSRVPLEIVFDQGPGDLFVVRIAGNFVNDGGLASIEFGVEVLNAPLVMVIGHSGCGAIGAAIKVVNEGAMLPGHLPQLAAAVAPAVEAVKARGASNLHDEAIAENVRRAVSTLATSPPILAERVKEGRIKVVGAIYDLATGRVQIL